MLLHRGAALLTTMVTGLVLAPIDARADSLARGIEAYERIEYDRARKLLQRALEKGGHPASETAKIHLYLGIVLFSLGQRERAPQEFRRALELDKTISPPPETSPKILDVFAVMAADFAPGPAAIEPAPQPAPPDPPPAVAQVPPPLEAESLGTGWLPWVIAGAATATLVAGVVAGVSARSASNEFNDQHWAADAAPLAHRVESRNLLANVLFATSGVLFAGAGVLFFIATSQDAGSDPASPGETVGVLVQFAIP